ncbi:alcohol dehydrogenase [Lentzea waywayandensis]|uniref:Alcohol dehydrogenase n=1 Tax=Lentzea waywayandensis TaxID=84724 RepID=A0A1I6F7G7_9PSEU|nr:alcohol dehydrogenase catalytic domain-containing protein [Lentzea waywayandensis]SFR25802.1 alcohol dehydrogenase [Lentzea waywayandensis]
MRVLEYIGTRELRWREVPDARVVDPGDAVVRPVAATTCDLDRAVIAGRTPFPAPLQLGHECVAEVVEVGDEVSGLVAGDLVVVPWHISCGTCATCSAGAPSRCLSVPRYAMFGLPLGGAWGGLFSELVRVPWAAANLVKLPDGVGPAAFASASDNLTDAYGSVLKGQTHAPGAPLLVFGGTSIGLYACAFARALNASRVVYVDASERRRAIAEGYGAQAVASAADLDQREFPLTYDASGHPDGLTAALKATEPGGHCHSAGIYFAGVTVPTGPMYMNAVTFTTGRPDITPHLPAVLALVAGGEVDPLPVFSDHLTFDLLPETLALLPEKPLVTHG